MWKVDDGDRGLCVTLYKHERMSAYQVDMLAACRIEGLLLPTVQYRDQRVMLLYRKGAATSLARMAASGPAPDYAGYSRKALALLLECSRYLIYGGSVALDPELLFVGEGGTVSLPFMPFNLFGSALRGAAHYFAGCEALSLSHGGPHGLMAGMRALAEGMVASSAEGQLFLASQARFLKELDMALEAGRVAVGKDPTGEAGAVGAKGHGPAAAGGADAGSGAGSDAGSVRMGGERRQGRTGGAGPIGMVIEAIKRAIARFGHPRGDGRRAGRAGARRKALGKERMASGIGGASLSMGGMLPSLKQLRPIADARQALWYGPASAGIDPELKGAWDERRQGWARCDAVGESVFNGLCGDYGDRVAMVGDTKADGLPPGPAGRVDAAATARADGFPPGPAGRADAAASAGADGLPPGPAGRVDAASLAGADGLPPGPAGRADAAASAGADGLPPGPAGQADAAASAGADGLPPGPAGRADAAATARADGLPPGPAGRADAAASGETVNLSATELLVKPFYLFRTYDPYEVQYRRKMLGDGVRFGKVGNHALDPPERHKLMGPVTRIGRSAHESDIVLKNITVGKRHAQIKREGQRHYLIDMKSLNGTYLNGGPIEPGVWEEIRSGDRLTFADWEYAFTDEPDMLRYP